LFSARYYLTFANVWQLFRDRNKKLIEKCALFFSKHPWFGN
jgi:hypothetical protein